MKFYVMTLFPEMIQNIVGESILGRAISKGVIEVEAINIRDYTKSKHKKVDDYPYSGGAGMLMQVEPIHLCHKAISEKIGKKPRTIYLTPQGRVFTQELAEEFAKEEDLVFLCGHYEGVDERALELTCTDFVSIGDYVLTGGELPAVIMIDAISRLIPGVLGNEISSEGESFAGGLLEQPQYTRPEIYEGMRVPEILLSGHQAKIEEWKLLESIKRTKERRPDLYERYIKKEGESSLGGKVKKVK